MLPVLFAMPKPAVPAAEPAPPGAAAAVADVWRLAFSPPAVSTPRWADPRGLRNADGPPSPLLASKAALRAGRMSW